jgi:hypothetical protein
VVVTTHRILRWWIVDERTVKRRLPVHGVRRTATGRLKPLSIVGAIVIILVFRSQRH